jgi:trans-aconitate methyltransferase
MGARSDFHYPQHRRNARVHAKGASQKMMGEMPKELWGISTAYELYVGRWSRLVAKAFLSWLALADGKTWVDVGCGTGVLVGAILDAHAPSAVVGIDRAAGFLAEARRKISDPRARFEEGDATALPLDASTGDCTVSGLVLNFVPDHTAMVREMMRVTKPGGKVAAYVWDYAGGMQMMRHFWDAAIAVNPQDAKLDQAERFPLCEPQPLRTLFEELGLSDVRVRSLDIPTVFRDFDDYWTPFLGRQGAAPAYLATLDDATREQIRQRLHTMLRPQPDGKIALTARAWAVQGTLE